MPSEPDEFVRKVVSLLKADVTIKDLVKKKPNGDAFISPSKYGPTGNLYPQITYTLKINESVSEVFPAGRFDLQLRLWVDEKDNNQYDKGWTFRDAVDALFNRKAGSLTDTSKGLRVANCLRRFGEWFFDREVNKFYMDYRFDVTISEGESFLASDAGDVAWV